MLAEIKKAITAGAGIFLAGILASLPNIDWGDGIMSGIFAAIGGGLTWWVKNRPGSAATS